MFPLRTTEIYNCLVFPIMPSSTIFSTATLFLVLIKIITLLLVSELFPKTQSKYCTCHKLGRNNWTPNLSSRSFPSGLWHSPLFQGPAPPHYTSANF